MPLGTEVGLTPGDIVLDGNAAPPMMVTARPPPVFQPMSIVAKRSPISAVAELLFYLNTPLTSEFVQFIRKCRHLANVNNPDFTG